MIESITTLWEEFDRPCSEAAVLACAERRISAHDDERAVLVHGDVHHWNALQSGTGFKLVDPDGLLAEEEYDLGDRRPRCRLGARTVTSARVRWRRRQEEAM